MSKERVTKEVFYPESDGKPMADNTLQFRWIVTIKEGLDLQLKDDFVAGDLFWYPIEGNPFTKIAPDVMVALGRPKGDRRSYKQWEENNIAPQVVFETISYTNSRPEMEEKLRFYEHFDVQEYYLYDPEQFVYKVRLRGWTRRDGKLIEVLPMNGWVSPLLNIRFDFSNQELKLFHPDGSRFLSFAELEAERLAQQNRAEQAENRAEQAENQVQEEKNRAKQAQERANQLAEKLRALGVDPESIS